jgi:hypothetical protein
MKIFCLLLFVTLNRSQGKLPIVEATIDLNDVIESSDETIEQASKFSAGTNNIQIDSSIQEILLEKVANTAENAENIAVQEILLLQQLEEEERLQEIEASASDSAVAEAAEAEAREKERIEKHQQKKAAEIKEKSASEIKTEEKIAWIKRTRPGSTSGAASNLKQATTSTSASSPSTTSSPRSSATSASSSSTRATRNSNTISEIESKLDSKIRVLANAKGQKELMDKFTIKYGSGRLDVETGEIVVIQ